MITKRKIMHIIFIIFGSLFVIVATVVVVTYAFLFTSSDRKLVVGGSEKFQYNDSERTYRVHKSPESADKIIVALHGFGDSSRKFSYYSALHNIVDNKTIVIYPDATESQQKGIMRGWNAGFCCGSGYRGEIDDSGFILSLVEHIRQTNDAASAKLFVTGFSNGAFMTARMATEHPDLIKGAAVVSGSIGTTKSSLNPITAVPILIIHGEKDKIVPFNGGIGTSDMAFEWLDFNTQIKRWENINKPSNVITKIQVYPDLSHTWRDWRLIKFWHKTPYGSKEVAEFFNGL